MRYEVPQFIDIEDKIFGPLSFKEFAYIAGACGLSYILYRFIPSFFIALLFIIPVLTFGALLAFYRPNNKPFIEMVQSAILFTLSKKLYIWKKEKRPLATKEVDLQPSATNYKIPLITENKLSGLNFDLDTKKGGVVPKKISEDLSLKI